MTLCTVIFALATVKSILFESRKYGHGESGRSLRFFELPCCYKLFRILLKIMHSFSEAVGVAFVRNDVQRNNICKISADCVLFFFTTAQVKDFLIAA